MISKLEDIDSSLRSTIIKQNNEGKNVNRLIEEYNLSRNEILGILNENVPLKNLEHYLSNASIKTKRVIVISDTHLGSELDQIKYLDTVYNYAKYNGIDTIIHCGDLMQSTIRPVKKNLIKEEKQLDYVVKSYPQDEEIKNYILLGNHDHHILRKNDDFIKVLESRSDFNLLGFKRTYLKWNKYLITLSHDIDKYHINIPNIDTQLKIVGHRHELKVSYPAKITMPSLSDDLKRYSNTPNLPGFIVLEMNSGRILGHKHVINPNDFMPMESSKIYNCKLLSKNMK